MSHLSRLVSDVAIKLSMRKAKKVFRRWLGVYREEIAAIKEEHQFISHNFTQADLESLRQKIENYGPEDADILRAKGFLSVDDKTLHVGPIIASVCRKRLPSFLCSPVIFHINLISVCFVK